MAAAKGDVSCAKVSDDRSSPMSKTEPEMIAATKIRTESGWNPRVNFEDGMRKTVEWYLDNKAWIASVTDGSYREYYEKMYGEGNI